MRYIKIKFEKERYERVMDRVHILDALEEEINKIMKDSIDKDEKKYNLLVSQLGEMGYDISPGEEKYPKNTLDPKYLIWLSITIYHIINREYASLFKFFKK